MKKTVIIEKGNDGTFSVYTTNLKCAFIIGSGRTVSEAKADFDNSVKEAIEIFTEDTGEVPKELANANFEFKYDIASFFNHFDCINISRFAKLAGINDSLMRHYARGDFYISSMQAKKIENALHKLGKFLYYKLCWRFLQHFTLSLSVPCLRDCFLFEISGKRATFGCPLNQTNYEKNLLCKFHCNACCFLFFYQSRSSGGGF